MTPEEERLIQIRREILERAIRMYEDQIARLQDDLMRYQISPGGPEMGTVL